MGKKNEMWKTTECSKATVFYFDDSHKTENAMETLERSPKRWNQHTTNTNTCARQCIGCVGLALFIFRRVCVCVFGICLYQKSREKKHICTFNSETLRRMNGTSVGMTFVHVIFLRMCELRRTVCIARAGEQHTLNENVRYASHRIATLQRNFASRRCSGSK